MSWIQAIIIAIVEGITEFLPVSSTGHMIITEKILGIDVHEGFIKTYTVAIQLGAILSVVVLYHKRFFNFSNLAFYFKIFTAVIPALLFGYLLSDKIDALLESPLTVSLTLLGGGIVLLFIDQIFKPSVTSEDKSISYAQALLIGLWQCIAMIPGVSRSAASIIGGMQQGLSRKQAAEFSFFLAVPTMAAATGYKLIKEYKHIGTEHIKTLALGNAVAFVVALLAIRFFIGYLQRHGFRLFGWYRIIVGSLLLVLIATGVIH